VTVIVAATGDVPLFAAMNDAIFPLPLAPKPMLVVLFDQLYTVPGTPLPLKFTAVVASLAHTVWSPGLFADGTGFTVIKNDCEVPKHFTPLLVYSGITVTVAVTGEVLELTAVNAGMFPTPDPPRPIEGVLFVQLKTVPGTAPVKVTAVLEVPPHKDWSEGSFTVGVGFTVTVAFAIEAHPLAPVTVTVYEVVDIRLTVKDPDVDPVFHW